MDGKGAAHGIAAVGDRIGERKVAGGNGLKVSVDPVAEGVGAVGDDGAAVCQALDAVAAVARAGENDGCVVRKVIPVVAVELVGHAGGGGGAVIIGTHGNGQGRIVNIAGPILLYFHAASSGTGLAGAVPDTGRDGGAPGFPAGNQRNIVAAAADFHNVPVAAGPGYIIAGVAGADVQIEPLGGIGVHLEAGRRERNAADHRAAADGDGDRAAHLIRAVLQAVGRAEAAALQRRERHHVKMRVGIGASGVQVSAVLQCHVAVAGTGAGDIQGSAVVHGGSELAVPGGGDAAPDGAHVHV